MNDQNNLSLSYFPDRLNHIHSGSKSWSLINYFVFLSKLPPDHESVQPQVVSSPFPHFVNSPAELPVLHLPDEEEPVMEGDLHCLALSPPPDPGLLSSVGPNYSNYLTIRIVRTE